MLQRFPTPIRSGPDSCEAGRSSPNLSAAGTTSALVMLAVSIRKYELHESAMADVMPISSMAAGKPAASRATQAHMSRVSKLVLFAVGQSGEGFYQRAHGDWFGSVIPPGGQHRPGPDIQQQERYFPAGKLAFQNSGSRLREQGTAGGRALCACHGKRRADGWSIEPGLQSRSTERSY